MDRRWSSCKSTQQAYTITYPITQDNYGKTVIDAL